MRNNTLHKKDINYEIKIINSIDTYEVRHPVLRAGKPIESCIFDGDNLDSTIHLGLYENNKLLSVCSFLKNSHKLLSEKYQYQLRGMAVLDNYQGKDLGNIILNYGETLLKNKNIKIVWCNARETASNFYKKSGYQIIGDSFNIKGIGKHFTMFKQL